MARAKRTDRADARRRYRVEHPDAATPDAADEVAMAGDVIETGTPVLGRPSRTAANSRPGLLDTLRRATGRPNFAEDVRALPQIARRSKALWLPTLIIVAVGLLLFIPSMKQNPLVAVAVQVALWPPPMIMPFLGGMLAPRGAWLVGGIIGFVNWVGFSVLIMVLDSGERATPLGWTYVMSNEQRLQAVFSALLQAVPFGILVGAFAGFYRRFLTASSPSRQARPSARRR